MTIDSPERRTTMEAIQDYIPVTKAKAQLLEIIRKIQNSDEAIAITKNGEPEAVLMSMEKFNGLLETLDILADEKAMASIKKSIKQALEGKWLSYEEVFGS
ncbi:MAG TPA: type II toxin-antitoxin system Phd/YefM family antitoxin [Deltaproteobacteria bacterium]|nr:type II toxin-antitoxin system Phd/YefM family antitoxin [Deltaproteobacteria bacterium]